MKGGAPPPDDIGLNLEDALSWFPHEKDAPPYVFIRVSEEHVQAWTSLCSA